jgi:DNA-directed RNA polymerase subunit RPC12/RpoP
MSTSFKCPTCAAPLDIKLGAGVTMRCPYCENTVILPEELRGGAGNPAGREIGQGAAFGPMIDQALKMAEMAQLIRAGNKIAAIKLYRETFGVGLKEAKDAVERIGRGEPITLTRATMENAQALYNTPPLAQPQLMQGHALNQKKGMGGRCLILAIVLIVAITGALILFAGGAAYFVSHPSPSGGPMGNSPDKSAANSFANVALEFGSEGIGAGQFKDARSIATDGEGHIYTAEYIGGRVQVFDAQGKFLTQWMVDPKRPLSSTAADRKGNLYIIQGGTMTRYEGATGERLGEIESRGPGFNQNYSSVFAALDGSLYAIAANYNIVHIGTDGRIKTIFDAREKTGDDLHLEGLAVSGSGHIYALDRSESSVFKFGPDGKYINRFGGRGDAAGQLRSPDGIGVDGQGRVYVCDVGRGIQVFDAGGRFVDSFAPNEVIFEVTINDRNEIFASQRNRHKIVKYVLSKP